MERKDTIKTPLLVGYDNEEKKGTEMKSYTQASANSSASLAFSYPQSSYTPQIPNQPSRIQNHSPPSVVPSQAQVTACAGCRAMLSYPMGALCVKCPMCTTMTAVQAIGQIVCSLCRNTLIYPAQVQYVSCTCGIVFNVAPIQPPPITQSK